MRRAGDLSLQEVAEQARVSPARISQIQAKIERGRNSAKVAQVLNHYKLRTDPRYVFSEHTKFVKGVWPIVDSFSLAANGESFICTLAISMTAFLSFLK
jgi:transcriptional regulator with XRE-family HTH domain